MVDFEGVHTCKDFDAILEWAWGHHAQHRDEMKLGVIIFIKGSMGRHREGAVGCSGSVQSRAAQLTTQRQTSHCHQEASSIRTKKL
jgi:hypothetical protein